MEFDLIDRYFKAPFARLTHANGTAVPIGIGDDCAAIKPDDGHTVYVSTDTLVAGVHFFSDDQAVHVGWKSLACNLSDLAASGATPLGFTMNLSLPTIDHDWLDGFSKGLLSIANRYNCPLIGGDTTAAGRNPETTISITVLGQAPTTHGGFHRSRAQAGDDVWVSGTPGLARIGLLLEYERRNNLAACCAPTALSGTSQALSALPAELKQVAIQALQQPKPRIELAQQLRGVANAALDLSDGLSGDLSHIGKASKLRVTLFESAFRSMWLGCWPDLGNYENQGHLLDWLVQTTLQGGDDFELCWTSHPNYRDTLESMKGSLHLVGTVCEGDGVWLTSPSGNSTPLINNSFNHFPESDC